MSIDLEMEEILKVFYEESDEGLNAMETGLLELGSPDCASGEVINTIFRAAHSIKGGAGTFGFMEISHFTHSVETLLDEMRTGKREVSVAALQLLLQSVDVIRSMIRSVQAKQPIDTSQGDALSVELSNLLAGKSADQPPEAAMPSAAATPLATAILPPATQPSAAAGPAAFNGPGALPPPANSSSPATDVESARSSRCWRIVFTPDPTVFATCNDPSRIFGELKLLGDLEVAANVAGVPRLGELDPTLCHLSWTLVLRTDVDQARVREAFDWVDANSTISYQLMSEDGRTEIESPAPAPAPAPAPSSAVPPTPPLLPPLPQPQPHETTARAVPAPAALAPDVVAPVTLAPAPSVSPVPGPTAAPRMAVAAKPVGDAGSIRVSTEKVDALINLVGELVITQSMLGQYADNFGAENLETLRRGLTQLSRNTRELQESVMAIRMLPIGFSFNRFPRLVHDLSRKLAKKVELKIKGENTELDKTVLEKIGDPLVHLVRNSLDHGLELPEVRLSAGKPETGVLELNAFHEGGSIVIEVRDDGAGLNTRKILAKAKERGLVQPGQELSDAQIHDLIFEAGFSTADTVSDVSGRGVGMDVVRRNIADLGGHVQIDSVAGVGSTIRIRLPLTLAILDAQMLRVGKEIYVVSLVSIIETLQPVREHVNSVINQSELFTHRGDYIPIIRLHELFGIEPDSVDIVDGLLVVVEADGRRAAILVDELLAQQQVVIKSLEANFRQVPGLSGATIHGDGTVALILDVPGLVTDYLRQPTRRMGWAA